MRPGAALLLLAVASAAVCLAQADEDSVSPTRAPVCGSDGHTYCTRCDLECAASAPATPGVAPPSLEHDGPCRTAPARPSSHRSARAASAPPWVFHFRNCTRLCANTADECPRRCVNKTDCHADCLEDNLRCSCQCRQHIPKKGVSLEDLMTALVPSKRQEDKSAVKLAVDAGNSLQKLAECLADASEEMQACRQACRAKAGKEACRVGCVRAHLDDQCNCVADADRGLPPPRANRAGGARGETPTEPQRARAPPRAQWTPDGSRKGSLKVEGAS